jgi:hypothetical protein
MFQCKTAFSTQIPSATHSSANLTCDHVVFVHSNLHLCDKQQQDLSYNEGIVPWRGDLELGCDGSGTDSESEIN